MNPCWRPLDVMDADTDEEFAKGFDDEELELYCLSLCSIDETETAASRRYRQLVRWTGLTQSNNCLIIYNKLWRKNKRVN